MIQGVDSANLTTEHTADLVELGVQLVRDLELLLELELGFLNLGLLAGDLVGQRFESIVLLAASLAWFAP